LDSKIATGLRIDAMERRGKKRSGGGPQKGSPMRVIFGIFPLLAIPVVIYNLMALTAGGGIDANGVSMITMQLSDPVRGTPIFGAWRITGGDILIILSMVFFFVEILKSTSTGSSTIANHAVSMLVFIVCLVEFLLLPNFQTSTFFILTVMSLLDVLAGVVVTIVSARRDFSVGDNQH
jgi:hypothetical protein